MTRLHLHLVKSLRVYRFDGSVGVFRDFPHYKLIVNHSHSCGPLWGDRPCPIAPMGILPRFWFCIIFGAAGVGGSFLLGAEGIFPLVSSASAISSSCTPLLLCRRARLGGTLIDRFWAALAGCGLGGPGAMGTTPPAFEPVEVPVAPLALDAVAPTDPVDLGDSESA